MTTTTETEETKEEAKSVKNTLVLKGSSQTLIRTVSNINAVGSGIAVQTNVLNSSTVSGNMIQSNVANVVSGL